MFKIYFPNTLIIQQLKDSCYFHRISQASLAILYKELIFF